MKEAYLELYDKINETVFEATRRCVELEHEAREVMDLKQLSDLAYVVKESSDLVKGLRVEIDKLATHIAKIFYVLYASDPNTEARIKTEWCTAAPDPKVHSALPKPDTDPAGYAACLRDMGVSEEVIASGAIRLSWDSYSDYVTALVNAGKPIPGNANPNKTYTEHRVKVRARRKLGDQRREPGDELVPMQKDDNDDNLNDPSVPF